MVFLSFITWPSLVETFRFVSWQCNFLVCNLAMWLLNTLETNRADSHPIQVNRLTSFNLKGINSRTNRTRLFKIVCNVTPSEMRVPPARTCFTSFFNLTILSNIPSLKNNITYDLSKMKVEFYGGAWAWPMITHISMPLAIFYR